MSLNEGRFTLRDPEGRIVDALTGLVHRLEEAHPAASYNRSDIARRALLWALAHPTFQADLGLHVLPPRSPGVPSPGRRRLGGANLP